MRNNIEPTPTTNEKEKEKGWVLPAFEEAWLHTSCPTSNRRS